MTEAPADRLRRAGLRATRPRAVTLGWLDAHPGHHPAEAVVTGTGLSKATAYHVLGQLVDAGLVLTAEAGPGRVRYESASTPHHHFVCLSCGAVIDVPCATNHQPCLDLTVPQAATVERAEVILKGRCLACA
jgi:Fur family ferric uptake transcriptional regulator